MVKKWYLRYSDLENKLKIRVGPVETAKRRRNTKNYGTIAVFVYTWISCSWNLG